MLDEIEKIEKETASIHFADAESLEQFRPTYLSSKGKIQHLMHAFRNLPGEDKKTVGKPLNALKARLEEVYKISKQQLTTSSGTENKFDTTLQVSSMATGSSHPLKIVENTLCDIFYSLGFDIADGPEIEDDWHNFGALNFADDHPARDMQDTFFIGNHVLRTHTSSVQIREMEKRTPPIRLVMPGRVYRNEAISSRSNCFFHQIEGLYIDKGVSFADLKQTLYYFVQQFFGEGTQVRFRSSYFPFTEPSAEMDIWAGTDTEENRR